VSGKRQRLIKLTGEPRRCLDKTVQQEIDLDTTEAGFPVQDVAGLSARKRFYWQAYFKSEFIILVMPFFQLESVAYF
jgi:hypothetical protein